MPGLSAAAAAMLAVMNAPSIALVTSDPAAAVGSGSWTLLLIYVAGALATSFLCSVLEAVLLSARLPMLLERSREGDDGATRLLEIQREQIDDAISAILTLNTIAHTVGSVLAGAQAAKLFDDLGAGIFAAVLTLLVLVVTEIIPKTLGTVHAGKLVGFVATTLTLLVKLLAPFLFVTRILTRLVASHETPGTSRAQLAALVAAATTEGNLLGQEARLLQGVLTMRDVVAEDVMTPRTVAVTIEGDQPLRGVLDDPQVTQYSRIPVHEGGPDEVVGYVLMRELLEAVARNAGDDRKVHDLRRPVRVVPETTPLPQLLQGFLEARDPLAIVVDEHGGMAGLVTLEDVIETVVGAEIVDELDPVADLRELAARQRDQRLRRLAEEHSAVLASPGADAEDA
ncbi:MAG: CNNM domain-containing protein [Acidobacteriota bacterium]